MIVRRIARWNSSGRLAGLEPGEVGEDRGLDRLEELQRRADDEQHVEHEAGQRPARVGVDDQHRGVHQRLLGEHDPDHRHREAGAVAERQTAGVGVDLRLLDARVGRALAGGVGHRHPGPRRGAGPGGTRTGSPSARRTAPPPCRARPRPDRCRSRTPPPAGTGSGSSTRGTPGRRTARSARGRRASRGRSSWRRRRARRRRGSSRAPTEPSNRSRSIRWRRASAAITNTRGEPGLDERRNPQRMAGEPARAAVGDRAAEQLLDRPVDHRQDHEHDRPAQRNPPVGLLARGRGWRSPGRRT